jgi:autoinducer 2-degrading protein
MIKRIVKMSFELEKVEKFKSIYELNWHKIKGFEGCLHVELLQDRSSPSIFFTYSNWESENHLNNYRDSIVFKTVWASTKVLFNDKPEAWTLNVLEF